MPPPKTLPTAVDPRAFIEALDHPVRPADGLVLLEMMQEAAGQPPVMWGPTIVGYGSYRYGYASGHEGEAAAIGFSPRKASLSLYGLTADPGSAELLARLGKHKVGSSCLYVNKLGDVDLPVLRELMDRGYRYMVSGSIRQ
ncbi:DUF1801 domain-containing protein [Arthrobacter sp. JSM 101049]|uniref:DUF1801 domain-containing protein n=1 Tax=Arthrobacter sp. JSM 101049 TaxID=929097 RepID=UPI003569C111